jgi:hypothetical protein
MICKHVYLDTYSIHSVLFRLANIQYDPVHLQAILGVLFKQAV